MIIIDLLISGGTHMAIAPVIIAAGISALSSLVGGGLSARAANKARAQQQESLNNLKAQEQSWYDQEYNADSLQRADAQRAINMVSEQIRQRNLNAAGQAAVGGLTDEAVARSKAEGNAQTAGILSDVVVANQQRKDAIKDKHQSNVMALAQGQMDIDMANAQQKLNNISTATQVAGNLGAAIAGADDYSDNVSGDLTPTGVQAKPVSAANSTKIDYPEMASTTQLNKG